MANMKYDDLRFVDPAFAEAFRANLLDMHPQFGDHPGLPVISPGDRAWIDEGIAELVFHMWRAGIRTTESCQDLYHDGSKTFIGFEQPHHLMLFLSLVAPQDDVPGGLWDRATGCNLATDTPDSEMWEYDMVASVEGRAVSLHTYVEFPPKDVDELVRRLKKLYPNDEES